LVPKEEHMFGLNRVLTAPGATDDPLVVEGHFEELPETELPGVCRVLCYVDDMKKNEEGSRRWYKKSERKRQGT